MPGLLQECFKIRRPVIKPDAQHMFPVKTDGWYQVECGAQFSAIIIVQHNEIFQVVIGIANQRLRRTFFHFTVRLAG